MTWVTYALLSALFAALTALFGKIGVKDVPSNLAMLIRVLVIVPMTAAIVLARGEQHQWGRLTAHTMTFLVLSAIATGLSWLCYYAALKRGPVSGVAPIDKLSVVIAVILGFLFLREKVAPLTWAGVVLIVGGVLLTLPEVQHALSKAPR
jgi:transporter family protein